MGRPYWLADAETESGVYLGFTKGQWPIQAFSADSDMAARWAAEDPSSRVLLGPIAIPDDTPALTAQTIPARVELQEVDG